MHPGSTRLDSRTQASYLGVLQPVLNAGIWMEAVMAVDLHKLALRLKVIEILERYSRIERQLQKVRQWKKLYVHPN